MRQQGTQTELFMKDMEIIHKKDALRHELDEKKLKE